jgi:prevent-host-death family protein
MWLVNSYGSFLLYDRAGGLAPALMQELKIDDPLGNRHPQEKPQRKQFPAKNEEYPPLPKRIIDKRTEFGTIKRLEVLPMKMSSDIKPVTYLKAKAADLLDQINETHRPVIITQNGEPKAVLQDPQSYENMRNALGMLKLLSQGEEDIKKGKTTSQEKVFAKLEKALKAK